MAEENYTQNSPDEKIGAEVSLHSPFLKKVENFWYHYKWHTIIGVFLALFILISTLQMCSRPSYDGHVSYAGPSGGEVLTGATLTDMQNSLLLVAEDYNGDGEKQISLSRYWLDTTENLQKYEGNVGALVNTANENRKALWDAVMAGETFLFFLSPAEFEDMANHRLGDTTLLYSVKELCPTISQDALYTFENGRTSAYGAKLSALPFGELPGFEKLPEDTVVCLRSLTGIGGLFSQDKLTTSHENHKKLFQAILSYLPEEP